MSVASFVVSTPLMPSFNTHLINGSVSVVILILASSFPLLPFLSVLLLFFLTSLLEYNCFTIGC